MGVGNTRYHEGTRVRIKGITDPHDTDLNGREGTLCQPFETFIKNGLGFFDVGVRLDALCSPHLFHWQVNKDDGSSLWKCGNCTTRTREEYHGRRGQVREAEGEGQSIMIFRNEFEVLEEL